MCLDTVASATSQNLVLFSGDFVRAQETNRFFLHCSSHSQARYIPSNEFATFQKAKLSKGFGNTWGGKWIGCLGVALNGGWKWIWLLLEILKMELAVLGLILLVSFWLKDGL